MTLDKRIDRLEMARGALPDPEDAATFAAVVEALDRLAVRKAADDPTVQAEIEALVAAIDHPARPADPREGG